MTGSTRLKGSLPKRVEDNGLGHLRRELLDDPSAQHVAIVVFDVARITEDIDGDGDAYRTPTIRILRLEPETDPDRAALLLGRAADLHRERDPQPQPLPGLEDTQRSNT